MSRDTLHAFADRYEQAIRRRDVAGLAAMHALDCVVESPMFATLEGRKAVEESFHQFFTVFPDIGFTIEDLLIDPPHLAVTSCATATHAGEFYGLPATHRRIEFLLARLVTLKNGLIAHERRVYDFTGLLVQVGVLRAKPVR